MIYDDIVDRLAIKVHWFLMSVKQQDPPSASLQYKWAA